MRTRYRWNPDKMKLEPISSGGGDRGTLIIGDLPDFKSPIDGTVVHGRKGLREHMKKHNVTHTQDFQEQWKRDAKRREEALSGRADRRERAEAIVHALEQRSRR